MQDQTKTLGSLAQLRPRHPPGLFLLAIVYFRHPATFSWSAFDLEQIQPASSRQNVQGTVDQDPPADGTKQYEALEGVACRGFHFVNVATLKLLSDEIED